MATIASYDALCKFVLRRRLARVFIISAVAVLLCSAFHAFLVQGGILTALSPRSLLANVIVFFLGVVPPIVLRKLSIQASSIRQPTVWDEIKTQASQTRTWRSLLVFTISGVCMASAQLPMEAIFAPTRRYPWHLSERFFYLILNNAWVGISFAIRDLSARRCTVQWPQSINPPEMLIRIIQNVSIFRAAFFATFQTLLFTSFYFPFRKIIWRNLLHLPIIGTFFRPFIANFTRHSHALFSPGILSYAIILAIETVLEWNVAVMAFDVVSSHPITVSTHSAEPHRTLISGITSPDPYFKRFAYMEFSRMSKKAAGAARRTALFTDIKSTPSPWSIVVREILLMLGNDYQTLLRRGKPLPSPPIAAAPPPPKPVPKTPKPTLFKGEIFKPQQKSPTQAILDALTSSAQATPSKPPAGALQPSKPNPSPIPSIFLALSNPPTAPPAAPSLVAVSQEKASLKIFHRLGKKVFTYKELPDDVRDFLGLVSRWLFDVRVGAVAEGCLPNRALDIHAVQVLCHLSAASLKEDPYGVVQRDIPRIIEALLKFLQAVEDYQEEVLNGPSGVDNSENPRVAEDIIDGPRRKTVEEVVQPLATVLKEGISLIIQTFRERLGAFKFPPATAKKLQLFVDYL